MARSSSWQMASWSVRLRPDRDTSGENWRFFGDFDERDGKILPLAKAALRSAVERDDDERPTKEFVEFLESDEESGEVAAWFRQLTYGIPGTIYDDGADAFYRNARMGDGVTQLVRLHLPPQRKEGLLTICTLRPGVAKNAVRDSLREQLREYAVMPVIEPLVSSDMLQEAIDNDRILRVAFLAKNREGDKFGDTVDFGDEDTAMNVTTVITPSSRMMRLLGKRFQKFFHDNDPTGLARFNGFDYDQVKATVSLPGGAERTITITDELRSAHPIWIELPGADAEIGDELLDRVRDELAGQDMGLDQG